MFLTHSGKIRPWQFKSKQHGLTEKSMEPLAVFHDGRSFIDAIASGLGVAQTYDKPVQDLIDNNHLVEILPEFSLEGPPVNALIPSGHLMPKKTRVFVEFLEEIFS